ncbi:hypothetical protein HDV06_006481 [Boothiomyces sp. JEL0866]|nr:hypothetical protein HDV06_006470 [Boothiomyces sp. JEL0866]KAJ3324588.1 hypothetical protein HDV06_006481 [Boothiomyces sp. JEL0866]
MSTILFYLAAVNAINPLPQQDMTTKQGICAEQLSYCSVSCFTSVSVNTCDPNTMLFQCQCNPSNGAVVDPNTGLPLPKGVFPTLNFHAMPVQFYECQAEDLNCVNGCVGSSDIATCSANCHSKYSCGSNNAGETLSLGQIGSNVVSNTTTGSTNGTTGSSNGTTGSGSASKNNGEDLNISGVLGLVLMGVAYIFA